MNRRSWFALFTVAALLGLAGTMIPASAQDDKDKKDKTEQKSEPPKTEQKTEPKADPKSEQKPEPPKADPTGANPFQWKAFDPDGKTFYQELYTNTVQDMTVMGMPIKQTQEQWFYVSWTPGKKDKDNWVVTQEIVDVKMMIDIGGNKIEYNSLNENQPSNPMTDFFNKLRKLKLTYHISPNFTVEKIEGRAEFVKELGGTNPQMEPLLKQILSEDALKQMAEPTWAAVPTKAVALNDKWTRSTTLNLGPIGSYTTDYTYVYEKADKNLHTIDIKADLKYAAPKDKMAQAGLPFNIVADGTTLKSTKGEGKAVFDSDKGRIATSDLTMMLEGNLVIEVSGMKTTVELKQNQSAKVKTTNTMEWKKK